MAKALITDCGAVAIAAGPALTAVPAGKGSTFTVRNSPLTSKVNLIDIWEKSAAAGRVEITSPNLVPVTNGIRIQTPLGLADFLFPRDMPQPLQPQDILTVQADGVAADVNGIAIQTYYDDLGSGMKLVSPGDISNAYEYIFGWPVAAVGGAAAGDQGTTVITTTVDSSDANKWYAVLGYTCDTSVLAAGIAGIDTSQLFIGGPGDTAGRNTRRYFEELCADTGRPCIPLFNAANKGSTNIVVVDNAAATAVNVTLILAQLPASYQPPSN